MRCILGTLVLSLFSAPVATAQDEPPPSGVFGERVDVEVVNVDVVVTDRDGRRVTDLGRDDFELRIDGKPVPIEYFSAPRALEPAPVVAEPVTSLPATTPSERAARIAREASSSPQSYIFVFIDQSALEIKTSSTIVDEIREFVLPQLDGTVAVLVAAYVDNLRILGSLSTDAVEVDRALGEAKKLRGRGTILATERVRLEAEIRAAVMAYESARLEEELRTFGEQAIDRQRRAVEALRQWVESLAAIEGRKSVLVATGGIASNPSAFLRSLFDQRLAAAEVGRPPVRTGFALSDNLQTESVRLMSEFEGMVAAAQNARVAFYTISPRTPPVGQFSPEFSGGGGEVAQAAPRDLALVEASSSVVRLGAATGGASLYADHELSEKLSRVVDDETASYSLGFSTDERAGGRDHPIEVSVRRAGVTTRHRESYRRRTLEDRVEQALSAAISLRAVANPLELGLELGAPAPLRKREKGAEVPLLVRIPLRGLALVPGQGDLRGKLSARVAIEGANGEVRFGGAQPIEVVVAAADAARIPTHNWAYRASLRLAPGDNRVAVVVVDELSGVFATTSGKVAVPKS